MEHRKENHPEVVQPCSKAATGECQKEKCWYMHSEIKKSGFSWRQGTNSKSISEKKSKCNKFVKNIKYRRINIRRGKKYPKNKFQMF